MAAAGCAGIFARLSLEESLEGIKEFLVASAAASEAHKQDSEEALAATLAEREPEIRARAVAAGEALAPCVAALLATIDAGEAMPREALSTLSGQIAELEEFDAFRPDGQPAIPFPSSDVIPDKLLAAEKGSPMYGGLEKKVKAICGRSGDALVERCIEAARHRLGQPGRHAGLDARRAELAAALGAKLQQARRASMGALVQSDHEPVLGAAAGEPGVRVRCWNVLEYPALARGADGVLDGIKAVVPYYIKAAMDGKHDKEQADVLLKAMASPDVVEGHLQMVVADVLAAFEEQPELEVTMLQEVNTECAERLRAACASAALHCELSKEYDDPAKCDAITALISRQPFDETDQVDCAEGTKMRHFMAARRGDTWFVSCHVPLVDSKPSKKGKAAEVPLVETAAARVLEQLKQRYLGGARRVVAGGDWNRPVGTLAEALRGAEAFQQLQLGVDASDACPLSLHLDAPASSTCLGTAAAIDGVFTIQKI